MSGSQPSTELGRTVYTADELQRLATLYLKGWIFTDADVHGVEVHHVFTPLVFLTLEQLEQLERDPPAMLFEEMGRATSTVINGMPTFTSVQMMWRDDVSAFHSLVSELRRAEVAAKLCALQTPESVK